MTTAVSFKSSKVGQPTNLRFAAENVPIDSNSDDNEFNSEEYTNANVIEDDDSNKGFLALWLKYKENF